MTLTSREALFAALALIYLLPHLVWRITRLDRFVPIAIVQIVVGLLLGPGILGRLWPSYYDTIFFESSITLLNGIAVLAATLFLFAAGVELDFGQAWRDRKQVTAVAGLGVGAPMLVGLIAALGMLANDNVWIGKVGTEWQFALGIGISCAVTALPVLVLILEKLEMLRTDFGQRVLRYASLDDIVLWGTLTAILMDWDRLGRQLIFLSCFVVSAFAFRLIIERVTVLDRWNLSLVWLAILALAADWAGLHYMVGAFFAGVVIDARVLGLDELDRFRDHVLLLLMPVFFLSTGIRTQWDAGGLSVIVAAAALFVSQLGGKLVGIGLVGRMFGWPKGEASVIGWLLQTKSLILLVFANILLERGIISGSTFAALVIVAVVSTVATIPAVRRLQSRISPTVAGPLPMRRPDSQ